MLTVSGVRYYRGEQGETADLLRLQGFVIDVIQSALEDPQRRVSDQLLLAVMIMALHEAIHGSPRVYYVHMEGFLRMLKMRGGLTTMGLDGLLESVVVWWDKASSGLVGCGPYCDGKSN